MSLGYPLAGLALAILPLTLAAKSASEVFALAAPSVVVVRTADGHAKPLMQGSGVALPGQTVATSCHVVAKAAWIGVADGGELQPAAVVYANEDRDVCLLHVQGLTAPPARLGSSTALRVGAPVYAIGTPRGLELTLSEGIVSSFRSVGSGRLIQTTAPISPGSSGGGLFDAEGQLVGLPSFMLRESQQLNFAVPVEWVKAGMSPTALSPSAVPAPPPQQQQQGPSVQFGEPRPIPKAARPKPPPPTQPAGNSPDEIAQALISNRDWSALLKHAQTWNSSRPDDPLAVYALGVAYYYTGQKGLTTDIYTQLKALDADVAEHFFENFVLPKP